MTSEKGTAPIAATESQNVVGVMDDQAIAAAVLVQTVFASDERLRGLLQKETKSGPTQQGETATANFLKPWYAAMLKMVAETRG